MRNNGLILSCLSISCLVHTSTTAVLAISLNMDKFFKRVPAGTKAGELSKIIPGNLLNFTSSMPVAKRPVGRPRSVGKEAVEITQHLSSTDRNSSNHSNLNGSTVTSEPILLLRIQKDGTMKEVQTIILAGYNDFDHCTVLDWPNATANQRRHLSELERNYVRSECHVWGLDNSHMSFRTSTEIHDNIKNRVADIAYKTVANILTNERQNYHQNAGEHYRVRPTLDVLNKTMDKQPTGMMENNEETHNGRPFTFPQTLYSKLKKRLMQFKNRRGNCVLHNT
jgi:hypothetical protein